MSATIVQSSPVVNAGAQATVSGTLTGVTQHNAIIALICYEDASNNSSVPSGVSDGTAYTLDLAATSNHFSSLSYSLFNVSAGSHTVTATKAAAATAADVYWIMQLYEVSGLGLTNSFDSASGVGHNLNTGPCSATTGTLASANDILFFLAGTDLTGGANLGYPAGWTAQGDYTSYPAAWFASLIPGANTAVTASAGTLTTSSNWGVMIAAYQAKPGAVATIVWLT